VRAFLNHWSGLLARALTVGLGGVVTLVDDQVLRAVVLTTGEVAIQNLLGALGVADLSIDGGTGHVGNRGVATAPGVLGVAERVVLGGGLGEPDVTTVAAEVARLEGLGNVLLDDDSTTGRVDEPSTGLHLGDKLLVEETLSLLVERAVDSDNVTLSEHLLEAIDTAAANLLLDLGAEGLVVVVEQLLAVEGLQTAKNTLTDTADSDGTDNLALEVVLVLGDSSDVPLTIADLVVGGDEVADQGQDGHDNVLSDGDDVGASDLGDGDTAVGLVGSVQVDVVGTDTSGDGDLQLLGLGEALSGEVTGVEGSGDDDFGVNQLLVEGGVLTLLVRGGDQGVALVLEPLANAELILGGTEQLRLLLGVLKTLYQILATEVEITKGENLQLTSYRTRRTLPWSLADAVSVRALAKALVGAKDPVAMVGLKPEEKSWAAGRRN